MECPQEGDDDVRLGPSPCPDGLLRSGLDTYEGVLKSGKEAQVHLVTRRQAHQECLLAMKIYRAATARAFQSDAAYTDGRHVRDARTRRAIRSRSAHGQRARVHTWAGREMEVLGAAWARGLKVPYPLAQRGSVLVLEYLGDEDGAAPRLVDARLSPTEAAVAAEDVRATMLGLAELGYVHGDLSPYNVLWWRGSAWVIDFPQTVDVGLHASWRELLARDVRNSLGWLRKFGVDLDLERVDAQLLEASRGG